MAHIIESSNPFQLSRDARRFIVPGGITIREWVRKEKGAEEFDRPTYCIVNGRAKMRAEWDTYRIKEDDIVAFVQPPGLPAVAVWVWVAIAVVAVAAAVYVYNSVPKPGENKVTDTPEGDPVFDLRGQRNQIKLGLPIEVPYGRNRMWPSVAAPEYNKYINNAQYRYSLYCLGQGSYDLEALQFEDTPLANFQDVTYEVYPPGSPVTLFPDNVITSVEVGTTELFGPNEPEYTGEAGPYVANAAGTQTNRLEVDVVLPQGLYLSSATDGTLGDLTITALFQYRPINDAGTAIGIWATLASFTKTLKTNTPQRFTLELDVPAGRYEVRAVRTNDKNLSTRASNTLQWVALRAFLPSTKDYGNVTIVAVKAKATNNLNDSAANRFNAIGTRKLRTRSGGVWTAEVATRSLVWAACDAAQADYGGRLADSYLFLDELAELDVAYAAAGIYFDYVFTQRSTLWETLKIIARVGRAVPMLVGSRITLIRDVPKTLPTAIFNQECIVEGSFSWEIKLAAIDEYDGVEVEYVDPTTWKTETVVVLVGDDAGNNLEQIKLPGCNDRTRAFREGYYYRAKKKYVRENINFGTGMEGLLPTFNDLIGVAHDLPRWATGGMVLAVESSRAVLVLSEPVTFVGSCVIGLRKKNGELGGPFSVMAGADSKRVVLAYPLPDDYYFDDEHEQPMFLFGPSAEWAKLCVVTGLRPGDDNTVEVNCVPYDARVFAGDTLTPPALVPGSSPSAVPDLPAVTGLRVDVVPNTPLRALVSWQMSLGASSYVVEASYDNVNWEVVATPLTNYAEISVLAGHLYIRVAAINVGAGAWAYWDDDLIPVEPGQQYDDAVVGGTNYNELEP